jgi:hypothetical protein
MVVSDRPRAPASQYRRAVGEGALAFLLRVCEELANSLDYDITLQKVAHLAVPFLADMCLVARTSPVDGRARAVAVSHVNAAMEARLREVLLDNDVESGGMVLRALRTRQPVIAIRGPSVLYGPTGGSTDPSGDRGGHAGGGRKVDDCDAVTFARPCAGRAAAGTMRELARI